MKLVNLTGSLFVSQSSCSSGSETVKKKIVSNINYVKKILGDKNYYFKSVFFCKVTCLFTVSFMLVLVLISFQESPDDEQSGGPKREVTDSGGGGLSAAGGGSFKPSVVIGHSSLASRPAVKLDPLSPSTVSKTSVSGSSLSMGARPFIRKPVSPMESLLGSPRSFGDGGTSSTTHLTASDLLKGHKP